MYIIFDGEGFKTIGDEQDVKGLLQQCEHGTEPYTIYALGDLYPEPYTDFVPDFYNNW